MIFLDENYIYKNINKYYFLDIYKRLVIGVCHIFYFTLSEFTCLYSIIDETIWSFQKWKIFQSEISILGAKEILINIKI